MHFCFQAALGSPPATPQDLWRRLCHLPPRPGSLGTELLRCVRAGDCNRLERSLREALPASPATVALLLAAHDPLELCSGAGIARRVGVSGGILDQLTAEVEDAARVLGRTADRMAAVAAQRVQSEGLQKALDYEAARLRRFRLTVRQVREALAELTLAGEGGQELETVELMLRWLAEDAREEMPPRRQEPVLV